MSENASFDMGEHPSPIEQSDDLKSESKVHVILNEAGFGKTFYMTWLAAELQKRFIELDEMKIQQLTAEEFVLLKIFAKKFNSKELVILMDGFDEVTPYYKAVVLKLLKVLDTFEGVRKIYLSSRPYDFRSELLATFKMKDCEQQFAPMKMVESFIEKKVYIVKIEKTGSNSIMSKTAVSRIDAEITLKWLKYTFSQLALFTVMSEDEAKQLLTDEEQNDALDYLSKIRNGSEKSGIIEGVVNNVPLFIHRLFAEYFAARWFFSNQRRDESSTD
ncbi:uncharacterized protein LOC131267326 [Anopheles coustani]|uniref:uncharacterized protein LOC131267326 n=1 Tax=Anopheles coustani TaxID=139045 RepID=UPI002657C3A1|nr:uncharacterized protein LOC131267326 [Anopheles coustani]